MTNHEPRTTRNEKGVILIVALIVIITVSIYLPAYVTWTIWDQRSLIRQQRAEEAKALAQAGLNRAVLDLYMDTGSWLDGDINGNQVVDPADGDGRPDLGNPDRFYPIYWTLGSADWTLGDNNHIVNVEIDYLQNCPGGSCIGFFDKRMRLRSTGRVTGTLGTLASVTLEEYVNYYVVKNITWTPPDRFYASLQQAINEAQGAGRNNDTVGITATALTENITINSNNWTIQGCYDPTFSFRSCSDYYTLIRGNWTVSAGANVNLSGVTID